MERSNGTKKGLRLVATTIFLAAALLSTGCGQNALMNPVSDPAQEQGAAINNAGTNLNPAGTNLNP